MFKYKNPKLNRYDSLIIYYCSVYTNARPEMIKKQMVAESYSPTENDVLPTAESPAGARGLMQFMKPAWKQYDYKENIPTLDHPFNAEENIKAGCKYMDFLYSRFGEIPDEEERYKFAMASYNSGRGNINQTLSYARESLGQPFSYSQWNAEGRPEGIWQEWCYAKRFLGIVTGINAKETRKYIKAIIENDGFYK